MNSSVSFISTILSYVLHSQGKLQSCCHFRSIHIKTMLIYLVALAASDVGVDYSRTSHFCLKQIYVFFKMCLNSNALLLLTVKQFLLPLDKILKLDHNFSTYQLEALSHDGLACGNCPGSQTITWPRLLAKKSTCCNRFSKIDPKWVQIVSLSIWLLFWIY